MVAENPWTKLRPPTGPNSPAEEHPPRGTGPSACCSARASWWATSKSRDPRPLQVNSRAAVGPLPLQEEVQLVMRRPFVAPVEPHRAAYGDPVVHGHRARRPVHPDHVPDEEVARSRLDLMLVDEATEEQPVGFDAGDLARVEAGP